MNKIKFKYSFIKQGEIVNVDQVPENTIHIDAGGKLDYNIIDHHQVKEKEFSSCAETLYNYSYLINVDKNQTINIRTHNNPDFDAIITVYLLKSFIINGSLSPHIDTFNRFSNEVDSGRFIINKENIENPATIIQMINNSEESDEVKIKKGIQLFELMEKQLNSINSFNKSKVIELNNPYLLSNNHPFKKEISEALKDYELYIEDKLSENTEIIKTKLYNFKKNIFEEVDGLFWNDVPKCSLHKHWARGDMESPNNSGFILTFIPQNLSKISYSNKELFILYKESNKKNELLGNYSKYKDFDKDYSIDEQIEILSEFKNELLIKNNKLLNNSSIYEKDKSYRVIIAVNPNSNYNIKGLGKSIELLEQKKEQLIYYKSHEYFKRKYFQKYLDKRYKDSWIDSHDPWYDGRERNYTIVDAPRRGTLLSIDQLKEKTLNFNSLSIEKNDIRILVPISYSLPYKTCEKSFRYILKKWVYKKKWINNINITDNKNDKGFIDQKVKNAFLPGIQDYMLEIESEIKNYSYYGEINYKKYDNKNYKTISEYLNSEIGEKIIKDSSKVKLYIFRYGIAYISFDFKYIDRIDEKLSLNELLKYNKRLSFLLNLKIKKEINNFKIKKTKLKVLDSIIYQSLEIDHYKLNNHKHEAIVYSLTNKLEKSINQFGNNFYDSFDNDIYLKLSKNQFYGFGKFGGCLINPDIEIDNKESLKKEFMTRDFIVFLLALHQRQFLIKFSNKIDFVNPYLIENLRFDLIDFMKSGWFSQIHKEEMGNKIFNKWKQIFKTEDLYSEVKEQLEVVNDYRTSNLEKKINRLTMIFIPLTVLAATFESNIFRTSKGGIVLLTDNHVLLLLVITIIIVSLAIGIGQLKYLIKKIFKL